MTPEALIQALSVPHPETPTELLRAATEHRDALTEPLLAAFAAWVDKVEDPDSEWDGDAEWLPDYAMYLLAQFREPRALPLYLRLCRLPEEEVEYWLGDILTQDMGAFLASTCAGDLSALRALLADEDIYTWSRWEALRALTTVAVQGDASLDEHVQWLLTAAQQQRRDPGNPFWTMLADTQFDLAAPALMPAVRQAYADDLPDPVHIAVDEIEEQLQQPPGIVPAETRPEYDYMRDAAAAIDWLIQARNRPDEGDDGFDDRFDRSFDGSWLAPETYVRPGPKVGRNDPCPCGSGKKYKKCCLNADPFPD